MKLIKCYVSSFGKLKDFEINFESGLNTIKEDNGFGKTTLSVFIKSMFYGLSGTGKRSIEDNERLKYKPWNTTERFGGYLIFEWKDKKYKIERFFGNKESEDSVRLFDVETNKEFFSLENLGRRIFDIDEEGFLSTTFLSQKDFEARSNASITSKFNQSCMPEDADAFNGAVKLLEGKIKEYKLQRGEGGKISDTTKKITIVENKLQSAYNSSSTVDLLNQEIKEYEKDLENANNEYAILSKKGVEIGRSEAISIKKSTLEQNEKDLEKYTSEKAKVDYILNQNKVTEEEISTLKTCIDDLVKTRASIDAYQTLTQQKQQQKNTKNNTLIFAILFGLFAVVSVISFAILNVTILGIASLVLALACAGIFVLNKFSKNKGENKENLELEKKLNNFLDIEREYCESINSFFARFNLFNYDSYAEKLNAIEEGRKSQKELEQRIQILKTNIQEIQKDLKDVPKDLVKESAEEISAQIREKQDKIRTLTGLISSKKTTLLTYDDEVASIPELEGLKDQLITKLEEEKKQYKIFQKTLEMLKMADENLKSKYRKPLEDSFNKYLNYIEEEKEFNAIIDVDLGVYIEEKGQLKSKDFYSEGYKNLFEICKRFALTDVIFTGEKPFIILDDPFFNLDDEKINKSLKLIKKLSTEYQIIYFVCHESRRA